MNRITTTTKSYENIYRILVKLGGREEGRIPAPGPDFNGC